MKKYILILGVMMTLTSCTSKNPFLKEWDTPYGVAPFDKITEADYIPAIKAGIKQQNKEIKAITDNKEKPTFENTVAPFELSGEILSKVEGVLYNLSESEASEGMLKIADESTPMTTEHENEIFMNQKLFERIKAVHENDAALTREQQMVTKKLYDKFVQNGVSLNSVDQAKFKEDSKQLAILSQKFGNNLLAENNAFEKQFGVPVSSYPSFMTTCEDRDLREKMFKAYSSRGNNGNEYDNNQIVLEIMRLRTSQAKLLGYQNSASYILENKMAHDPQTVDTFLSKIMDSSMAKAKEEVVDMQKIMDQDIKENKVPSGSTIQPWDWFYYAERVRKAKYDLNEDLTKPYFLIDNVQKGVFYAAHKVYGLIFEPADNVPVYDPQVKAFKVMDADSSLLGIFLCDYFPRSTKRGGAWMNNFREQYTDAAGNDVRPVIVNVCNLTPATDSLPALLTIDDVQTMFHEFGHALHGFLTKCHYKDVSGTNVARDFVECFSQFNENWAFQPEILAHYAFHYKTGELIPADLVEKINKSMTFNQGFTTGELCAASILDMKWHELESIYVPSTSPLASQHKVSAVEVFRDGGSKENMASMNSQDSVDWRVIDPKKFEDKVCTDMGLISEIIPRYRSTYFNHIFNSGYNAGYYSYLWSEVLERDAFEYFQQQGVFNPEIDQKFRKTFLERGGSEEPMTLYREFRGADPDPAALLRARGLE